MKKVIGFDCKKVAQFTCKECYAIVEYTLDELYYSGGRDEGTRIKGLTCPICGEFHRTNQ